MADNIHTLSKEELLNEVYALHERVQQLEDTLTSKERRLTRALDLVNEVMTDLNDVVSRDAELSDISHYVWQLRLRYDQL